MSPSVFAPEDPSDMVGDSPPVFEQPPAMTPMDPPATMDPVDPSDPVQDPAGPVDDPADPMDDPADPMDDPVDPMDDPADPVDPNAEVGVSGIDPVELDMLRQVCVDEINMYRATLSLPPIDRADNARALCSDEGAKKDADANRPHSSSGSGNPCYEPGTRFPGFQAQNTCPGWRVGGFGGNATIADALKNCLAGMWAEGEPPQGTEQCIEEYFNGDPECFLAHGHYINMKGDSSGVSCGFYDMGGGEYWMNQDFY